MIRRASNITEKIIEDILKVINSFSEKISWGVVLEKVANEVGERYTEQGLRKHQKIADAYSVKKVLLAKQRELGGGRTAQTAIARRILALEAENSLLKEENRRLSEKFAVWAHNAAGNGLTEDVLNTLVEL